MAKRAVGVPRFSATFHLPSSNCDLWLKQGGLLRLVGGDCDPSRPARRLLPVVSCEPVAMTSTYTIQSIEGNRWRIVDGSNRLVFVGDKSQAEAWLDWQDNARSGPSALAVWLHGVAELTARPLAHIWRRSRPQTAQRVS